MAYSGTHETTKFGERDSGNVLVVEIASRGAAPKLTPHRTGGLVWRQLERDIREAGDLSRVREEIEVIVDGGATLLDVRLFGVLASAEQDELSRIDELFKARFLYGRYDATCLLPAPSDESWLSSLPAGAIRDAARQLQAWSDPAFTGPRPTEATSEVAARALVELYAMSQGAPA